MSTFGSRLSILLVVATAIAVGLVGWAGGFLTIESLERPDSAVIVGLSLLVVSGLLAVLYEPLEIENESN